MATYYVRKTGSDGAGGTAPGTAWQTIGKALGAAGMASGDTVYIGAGTYRETVAVAMTNPTVETSIIGDPDGSHTGDPGEVIWSAYTTDDKTVPTGSATIRPNTRDFLTFRNMTVIGGDASPSCVIIASGSTDIKFYNCTFLPGRSGQIVGVTCLVDVASNMTWDGCVMIGGANASVMAFTIPTSASADYDTNIQIKNCLFLESTNATGVSIATSGASAFKPGGVDVFNSTFLMGSNGFASPALGSTTIPCTVYNSVFWGQVTACLNGGAASTITEDYNYLHATNTRVNVTAGGNSKAGGTAGVMAYAPLFQVGQESVTGQRPRRFFEPMIGSPILGFGNQAGYPTTDIAGIPRPSGPGRTWANALNAVGYLERGDTATKETTTVRSGSNAIKLLGPSTQDFEIPVNAVSTTVTVYGRYDSTYAGTKPAMSVINCEEAGVTSATSTMAGAADTWEQLSLTFTPTAAGIVTIRLRSSSTAGGGAAFFDDFNVA